MPGISDVDSVPVGTLGKGASYKASASTPQKPFLMTEFRIQERNGSHCTGKISFKSIKKIWHDGAHLQSQHPEGEGGRVISSKPV